MNGPAVGALIEAAQEAVLAYRDRETNNYDDRSEERLAAAIDTLAHALRRAQENRQPADKEPPR